MSNDAASDARVSIRRHIMVGCDIITKGLTELYALKARLGAERDGADSVPMPKQLADKASDWDVQEAMASERKLFELRRKAR